uniref:Ataxia telangiectasia mutated family protein n=1 Tax=Tanacetum cinerariifolium TaxID=118510 RepID=A0A6L2JKL3_TANCI|nr:ataxia telangiectasia mutated family protein [Tanacetum cinerariifolium]
MLRLSDDALVLAFSNKAMFLQCACLLVSLGLLCACSWMPVCWRLVCLPRVYDDEDNGYKLWYSGSSIARNGVGIILAERHKDNVARVTRRNDRIMAISVVIEGETVNVISAYVPQSGGHNTQIDNLLVRRCDLKACKDCRAFPAERAFEAQAEKDRTLMRLEELRFLATSTKDLDEDDAYWIKKQKRLIKNKMRNALGDEDDEDE